MTWCLVDCERISPGLLHLFPKITFRHVRDVGSGGVRGVFVVEHSYAQSSGDQDDFHDILKNGPKAALPATLHPSIALVFVHT